MAETPKSSPLRPSTVSVFVRVRPSTSDAYISILFFLFSLFRDFLRAPSTSSYVPRIMAEQTRIEAQLLELEGIQDIQVGLELTHISEDEQMLVDKAPEPRPIEAKLRALEKFVRVAFKFLPSPHPSFYRSEHVIRVSRFVLLNMILFLFRGVLLVNNMVTRSRGYQLKKLWNSNSRHTPQILRGNGVSWRGGKNRAS